MQGQLELVLASAGVAELEEVGKVILLLPCILLSLVRCALAPNLSRFLLCRCSLYLCSLFVRVVLCHLLATCAFRAGFGRLPGGNSGGVRERCGGL